MAPQQPESMWQSRHHPEGEALQQDKDREEEHTCQAISGVTCQKRGKREAEETLSAVKVKIV